MLPAKPTEICSEVVDRGSLEKRGVPSLRVTKRKSRRCNVGGKGTPMHRVHQDEQPREGFVLDPDGIAREGARRMLAQALEAEVEAYLQAGSGERDEHGRALVVRNGYARRREAVCGAGPIGVRAPRIDDDKRVDEHSGRRRRFRSSILPPYARRSPKVSEVLPRLYLHGLSTGDFVPALEEFFGKKAGLSATTIGRLLKRWQQERERFMRRDLSEKDYV